MTDPTGHDPLARALAFVHPAWMLTSLALSALALRAGLRLRQGRLTRIRGQRPRGELFRLHLRLAKPAVVLILIGLITWGWSTLVMCLLGAVVLVFAEVRVTVAQRGVVVSLGWLGVPSWTVPMEAMERAEVEQVNPMAYGGWGYRLRPGVRAVVTRGGEALRLVRTGKADLVLTVDDAATGAGVINSILGVDWAPKP